MVGLVEGWALVGGLINAARPPKQLGLHACISSRITAVIHVVRDFQINYD